MSNSVSTAWWSTLLLVGCLASLAAAPRASASDLQPLPARTVTYADLDLTRLAGVRVLRDRVGSAVRTVCRAGRPLADQARQRACTAEAEAASSVRVEAAVATAHERLEARAVSMSRAR